MKRAALILAVLAATAGPAGAATEVSVYRTTPSADVSFPFWV
jgi:predicted porin